MTTVVSSFSSGTADEVNRTYVIAHSTTVSVGCLRTTSSRSCCLHVTDLHVLSLSTWPSAAHAPLVLQNASTKECVDGRHRQSRP